MEINERDEDWEPPSDPAPSRPWASKSSVSKTELVARIAASTGQSQRTVDAVLAALFETLAESVGSGVKVSIPGWLAIERTSRAARTGRNPQTGTSIYIPAGHSVKISAGSKLKAASKGDSAASGKLKPE